MSSQRKNNNNNNYFMTTTTNNNKKNKYKKLSSHSCQAVCVNDDALNCELCLQSSNNKN